MDIIDFRLRPPVRSFLRTRIYSAPENRNRYTRALGFEPPRSAEEQDMDLLLDEMRDAGIGRAAVVGRATATLGVIDNDDVLAIAAEHPDVFVPVGSVDPTDRKAAMAEIDRIVAAGIRGINLEPGVCAPSLLVDDRRLYPIYAQCEDHRVPVILMCGGGAGPTLDSNAPVRLDRVLADFPDLTVVASHGNWPFVQEALGIAFRRRNLMLSPDMYWRMEPGIRDYAAAADSHLSEQFLFGTAYPFCPLAEYVSWFRTLPINDAAMERILSQNARRVLGLNEQ